jgi:hypothetical protein
MRLLSLFTMGVPSTESVVPMAHLLPLILSSLLCLGGSLLYASDWTENFPLNAVSFMVLFAVQFCFLAQGYVHLRPASHTDSWRVEEDLTRRSVRLQLAVLPHQGNVNALPRARRAFVELDPPASRVAQAGEQTLRYVTTGPP